MHLFQKIVLLLSSILLVSSCRISKYNHRNCEKIVLNHEFIKPVLKGDNALRFNATIDILKNHLTGLIIVKQTDSITKHIVFVTELGMKMFDFELKNNEIKTSYVFEPLNKPKLIDVLKTNFKSMLLLSEFGTNDCNYETVNDVFYVSRNKKNKQFFTVSKTKGLTLKETFYKRKRVSRVIYNFDSTTGNYTHIKCKQYGLIKFYFELTEMQN